MAAPQRVPEPTIDDELHDVVEAQAQLNHAILRLTSRVERLTGEQQARPTPTGTGRLLSVPQLVKETGLPRSRIYQLLHTGQLPFVLIDGRRAVRREDLEQWLATLPEVRR